MHHVQEAIMGESGIPTEEALGVPSIEILQGYFLEGSILGWAGGGAETTIPGLPGSRLIVVNMGLIVYRDIFWTHPRSDHSFGTTIMSVRDFSLEGWFPVWHMQYGGQYPEYTIACLKAALRKTYEAKEFVGGRGPLEFQRGNLEYRNHPDPHEKDFKCFKGDEEIVFGGLQVGFHWYRGGLMFPHDEQTEFVGPR